LIKYLLAEIGFSVKIEAKRGNCVCELSPEAFARLVSRFSRGVITTIECIDSKLYTNGRKYLWCGEWWYDTNCKCWVKDTVRFRHLYPSIIDVFDLGAYSVLNVEGKEVIDIGAFVGDSTIYFAVKGAKRVIAIESHPEAFKELLENISLNRLKNKVIAINAGLASKPGKICIGNVDVNATFGTYHAPGECTSRVPAITLSEIVKRYEIRGENAVLKMDCEGCEYDTILYIDPQDLKIFKEIIIEYHNGYRELKRFLEDTGFNTKIKPIRSFPQSIEKQGYLIAKRNIR
jgi:FkbM family methyltransferase